MAHGPQAGLDVLARCSSRHPSNATTASTPPVPTSSSNWATGGGPTVLPPAARLTASIPEQRYLNRRAGSGGARADRRRTLAPVSPLSARVFVAGPATWNHLVYLDRLPEPRPHTERVLRHHETVGGTSAGKALNLAALGARVTLRTHLGPDEAGAAVAERLTSAGVDLIVERPTAPSAT